MAPSSQRLEPPQIPGRFTVVGGDQIFEDLAEDQETASEAYEIVESGDAAEELFCPTCGLTLIGEEALVEGGIELERIDLAEREIEYGPDYGTDWNEVSAHRLDQGVNGA